MSGVLSGTEDEQVAAFESALRKYGCRQAIGTLWLERFEALRQLLDRRYEKVKECLIFIDELPCFDTGFGH